MGVEKDTANISHYYGDTVRSIFIISGALMIVGLPFFSSIIPFPISLSIIAILVLGIFGGFQNPLQKWVIRANAYISVAGFLIFAYYAVHAYMSLSPDYRINVYFFWVNEVLALLFFLSVYLSIKSLRGKNLAEKTSGGSSSDSSPENQ